MIYCYWTNIRLKLGLLSFVGNGKSSPNISVLATQRQRQPVLRWIGDALAAIPGIQTLERRKEFIMELCEIYDRKDISSTNSSTRKTLNIDQLYNPSSSLQKKIIYALPLIFWIFNLFCWLFYYSDAYCFSILLSCLFFLNSLCCLYCFVGLILFN